MSDNVEAVETNGVLFSIFREIFPNISDHQMSFLNTEFNKWNVSRNTNGTRQFENVSL